MVMWLVGTALAFDVQVKGVVGGGTVGCLAFRTADGFPGDHLKAAALAQVPASDAVDGTVVCRFPDITTGIVAVSVRHDVNGNGTLDRTRVGFPKEPFGVTRDAPLRMFGPPKFEDCVVKVEAAATVVNLRQR